MELHIEALDQESLQHFEKLLLGRFGRALRFGVDAETVGTGHQPIGASLDVTHGGDAEGDSDHMAETRILDNASAQRRRGSPLIRARISGIDPAASSAESVISWVCRFQ